MGARGPAPTPTAVLALRGSWRANRPNEPEPPKDRPPMPKHLSDAQKVIWRRVCKVLEQMRLLSIADAYLIERYCVFFCRWRDCEAYVAKHGVSYPIKSDDPSYYVAKLPAGGAVIGFVEHPQLTESHRLDAALKQIEGQLGLSPSARTRLYVEKPVVNPLAGFTRVRG